MKTTLYFTLTLLSFVTLAFVPNSFAQNTSPEYIVRLFYVVPSDQEPLPDIDATINEIIKNAQSVFAELMENHGFDRKTFTFETEADGNAVVHHINGAVSHANFYDKFSAAIDEIDEQPNTISLVMLGFDEPPYFCGEANRLDRVAVVKLDAACFNHEVMAHELGHTFGLWHHYIVDDVLITNSYYTLDPMLRSFCNAEWLNISRYLNPHPKNSTGPTTIQMLPPLASPPNAVRLRFEVADPDELYMAQLLVSNNVIACKRLHGEKDIVEFETTDIDRILDARSVTLWVIDETGDIVDYHSNTFPIDITPVLPPPETISITDPNLAAVVREELGLAPGNPITELDMLRLRALVAVGRQITNLTGLEHAIYLSDLNLLDNQIKDITPLLKLTNLRRLSIGQNQIRDLTLFRVLTHLRELDLSSNPISDITALSSLIKLERLFLGDSPISDIHPVWELTQLQGLGIRFLEIRDLSPLTKFTGLELLQLDSNQISDISLLAGMTNLRYLFLRNNQITDVSPFAELVNLRELYLEGNPIKNKKPLFELLEKNPDVKIYLKWGGEPLPVTLSYFRAELTDIGVVIKWTTESEVDNAGFYILRSETKDGEFKVVNPSMLQGAGTTGERNEYTWTDTTAKPNVVYYYRIEDVSFAGVRKQLATVRLRGLVSATDKLHTRWGDLKWKDTHIIYPMQKSGNTKEVNR